MIFGKNRLIFSQIHSFTKAEAIKFMKTKMPDEENVGEELLSFVETSEQLHNDTLKVCIACNLGLPFF